MSQDTSRKGGFCKESKLPKMSFAGFLVHFTKTAKPGPLFWTYVPVLLVAEQIRVAWAISYSPRNFRGGKAFPGHFCRGIPAASDNRSGKKTGGIGRPGILTISNRFACGTYRRPVRPDFRHIAPIDLWISVRFLFTAEMPPDFGIRGGNADLYAERTAERGTDAPLRLADNPLSCAVALAQNLYCLQAAHCLYEAKYSLLVLTHVNMRRRLCL